MKQFIKSFNFVFTGLAILAASSAAPLCHGQENLPTADEIVAKFVEKTGGLEKYQSIQSMMQKGTMSIPAAGISGTMQMKVASPDKILVEVSLPGAGNEKSGSDGETVWSDSTMMGQRLVTGKEKEQVMLESNFRRLYDPASVFASMECVGTAEVDGEKCYKVKVVKKSGDTQFDYYSVDSGLQVKADIKAQSPMGEMNIETFVSEYKDVDGILMPHKMIQKFVDQGMQMEVEFEEIKINPEFEEGTFKLPESIQKLVDKQKEKAAGSEDK